MSSLRRQFTDMAQELSDEAERRRQFVAKNRQETQRLCEGFQRDREQLGQQLQRQARKVTRELITGRQAVRRNVARMMIDLKTRRSRLAFEQRSQRHRFVAGIKRVVSTSLQRNRANLLSTARQRVLTSTQTIARLRSSVAKIRSESVRLTSTTASDMLFGRRALAAARSRRQNAGHMMFKPTSAI